MVQFISDLDDSSVDDRYQPISLPMVKLPKEVKTQMQKSEKKPVIKEEDDSDFEMETDDVPDLKVKGVWKTVLGQLPTGDNW